MKRRLTALAAGLGLALTIAACGAQPRAEVETESIRGTVRVAPVDLPDGRTVTCVTWKSARAGGLSCDWQGATR